jgi:hypothetical protein
MKNSGHNAQECADRTVELLMRQFVNDTLLTTKAKT